MAEIPQNGFLLSAALDAEFNLVTAVAVGMIPLFPPDSDALLQETGFEILTEDGDLLLLDP